MLTHAELMPILERWSSRLRITPAQDFAYNQFFTALEQTVGELTKCFLLDAGENRELSFGRCAKEKSFNELFDGLKNLE